MKISNMKRHFPGQFASLCLMVFWLAPIASQAHHFKGLPHYNYFENYPEIPEEEFLGQAGDYEVSLVVYDFQGIKRENVDDPNMVRLFLVIFNLRNNDVYGGPLTLEILDGGKVVHREKQPSAELENLYSMHQNLPDTGHYSLRLTLHDPKDVRCEIPFQLSSQKINWAKWVGAVLLILVVVAAVGARKKRVAMDRKQEAGRRIDRNDSDMGVPKQQSLGSTSSHS